ncbi:hypothetical protein [Nocardia camponoti]|uniref:hypothetical protein n=1 Tax=Nocardia camponoti TaxID=1616106 RepID=UPI001663E4F0|nr:hypothetical protein [Nocardia camponoti]
MLETRITGVTDGEYEWWRGTKILVLMPDGELLQVKRSHTQVPRNPDLEKIEDSVQGLDIENWDLVFESYAARDGYSCFKTSNYRTDRHTGAIVAALAKFDADDHSARKPMPPERRLTHYQARVRKELVTTAIMRAVLAGMTWLMLAGGMKVIEFFSRHSSRTPENPATFFLFPDGAYSTIALSGVVILVAVTMIDLAWLDKRPPPDFTDSLFCFLVGAAIGAVWFGYLVFSSPAPSGAGVWWTIPLCGVVAYLLARMRRWV